MSDFTPLKTGLTRVFIIEGRARPDHAPSYESSLRMGGLSQNYGDIERIESPDPDKYGKYIEVGQVRGAEERATTSLEGRYALDLKSELLRLAKAGCAVDVQLHMGDCSDPSDFNTFTKALVLEDAFLTNFSTEDLGSLASGDEAAVNESSDISARLVYELMQMTVARRADDLITGEVIDVVICGSASCGDCTDESDGCDHIYALTKAAGGSPSTPADILYSIDKGVTWYAHDVDSLGAGVEPDELACVGSYLVVVSNADGALHYALLSEFDGVTDPAFTQITTGIVAGGEPNAIAGVSTRGFIVGDGGYIYVTDDVTSGVTVQDAGAATTDNLLAVDALSKTFAVAVGNNGAIVKTDDGESWALVTPAPIGVGINFNAIALKSKTEWLLGTSDGRLFYTNDGGANFTAKTFPGSGTGTVQDIAIATDSVMYLSHTTAASVGRILRSYDGGYSWQVIPEGIQSFPDNDRITALAACADDPNFIVGVGLAGNATDGILVLGQN